MYIRNYGEYYSDKTKGEIIIDIEALEYFESLLWNLIGDAATGGNKRRHDQLTQCRMEVAALIDQLRANEAKAQEAQESTDAQE